MKIISANAKYIERDEFDVAKKIEKIGRICYKSEDAITDDSAEKFVKMLIERKHYAMLEHAKINVMIAFNSDLVSEENEKYLYKLLPGYDDYPYENSFEYCFEFDNGEDMIPYHRKVIQNNVRSWIELMEDDVKWILNLKNGKECIDAFLKKNDYKEPFSKIEGIGLHIFYNLFVYKELCDIYPYIFEPFLSPIFAEYDGIDLGKFNDARERFFQAYDIQINVCDLNEFMDDLLVDEEKMNFAYHTFLITTDRGVTHELVRHRDASFAQESTRYCNYSNGKFGNEITVIKPCFWEEGSEIYNRWGNACIHAEISYMDLINAGASAQEARSILPTSTKADIVITADENEWQHIIDLRYHGTTGTPHPQMKEVMDIIYPIIVKESEGRIK